MNISLATYHVWQAKIWMLDKQGNILTAYYNDGDVMRGTIKVKPQDQVVLLDEIGQLLQKTVPKIEARARSTRPENREKGVLNELIARIAEMEAELGWMKREYQILFRNTKSDVADALHQERVSKFRARFEANQREMIEIHKSAKAIFAPER
jgi:hypothetical protein